MNQKYLAKRRTHIKAQKLAGVKKDATDKLIFMEQCMSEVMDIGEADNEDDARSICEVLYEDEQDAFDW